VLHSDTAFVAKQVLHLVCSDL